ncbi:hypothetical protein B0H15DRAFT_953668 [Mycena belliarum]|uniref:BHLH domain-containing protein n=1 Tax=Mycena belliarum TaxID=1033014 RepID=A0AAD6TUL0_9AGAR|nr:hypothetical protein B0H15DRAFT_953668 [Mycena belliae]
MSYYYPAPAPLSPASSASSLSSGAPQTPVSPAYPAPAYPTRVALPTLPFYADLTAPNPASPDLDPADANPKQTPAARRASHNAVERARRESLNARFLVLAALLFSSSSPHSSASHSASHSPYSSSHYANRPPKRTIISAALAHARAAHRHRALASRTLRALHAEALAARREVDAWRARAGVAPLPPPVRGEGFASVVRGEDGVEVRDFVYEGEGDIEERKERKEVWGGPVVLSHPYGAPSQEATPPQEGQGQQVPEEPSAGRHDHPGVPLSQPQWAVGTQARW